MVFAPDNSAASEMHNFHVRESEWAENLTPTEVKDKVVSALSLNKDEGDYVLSTLSDDPTVYVCNLQHQGKISGSQDDFVRGFQEDYQIVLSSPADIDTKKTTELIESWGFAVQMVAMGTPRTVKVSVGHDHTTMHAYALLIAARKGMVTDTMGNPVQARVYTTSHAHLNDPAWQVTIAGSQDMPHDIFLSAIEALSVQAGGVEYQPPGLGARGPDQNRRPRVVVQYMADPQGVVGLSPFEIVVDLAPPVGASVTYTLVITLSSTDQSFIGSNRDASYVKVTVVLPYELRDKNSWYLRTYDKDFQAFLIATYGAGIVTQEGGSIWVVTEMSGSYGTYTMHRLEVTAHLRDQLAANGSLYVTKPGTRSLRETLITDVRYRGHRLSLTLEVGAGSLKKYAEANPADTRSLLGTQQAGTGPHPPPPPPGCTATAAGPDSAAPTPAAPATDQCDHGGGQEDGGAVTCPARRGFQEDHAQAGRTRGHRQGY